MWLFHVLDRDHKLFRRPDFPPSEEPACAWGSDEGRKGVLCIRGGLVLFRVVLPEIIQGLSRC